MELLITTQVVIMALPRYTCGLLGTVKGYSKLRHRQYTHKHACSIPYSLACVYQQFSNTPVSTCNTTPEYSVHAISINSHTLPPCNLCYRNLCNKILRQGGVQGSCFNKTLPIFQYDLLLNFSVLIYRSNIVQVFRCKYSVKYISFYYVIMKLLASSD